MVIFKHHFIFFHVHGELNVSKKNVDEESKVLSVVTRGA
jgi:hypothetical protein